MHSLFPIVRSHRRGAAWAIVLLTALAGGCADNAPTKASENVTTEFWLPERSEVPEDPAERVALVRAALRTDVPPLALNESGFWVGGKGDAQIWLGEPAKFKLDGQDYLAFVVAHPQRNETARNAFLFGKTGQPVDPEAALVVGSPSAPARARRIWLDPRALTCHGGWVEVGDFVGDGTLQARVGAMLAYAVEEPRQLLETTRHFLFRLPNLEPLLEATESCIAKGEDFLQVEQNTIEFLPAAQGTPRSVAITNTKTGKRTVVPYTDGKYAYAEGDVRVAKRVDTPAYSPTFFSHRVTIRVLDKNRKPLPGLRVNAVWKMDNLLTMRGERTEQQATTDARGEAGFKGKGSFSISVISEQYEYYHKGWGPDKTPAEPIVITLEDKDPGVPMDSRMFAWDPLESTCRHASLSIL